MSANGENNKFQIHQYWPIVLGPPPQGTADYVGVELHFAHYLLLWQASVGGLPTLQDSFTLTADVANSAFLTLQTPFFPLALWGQIVDPSDDHATSESKMLLWARKYLSADIELEYPPGQEAISPLQVGRWKPGRGLD